MKPRTRMNPKIPTMLWTPMTSTKPMIPKRGVAS